MAIQSQGGALPRDNQGVPIPVGVSIVTQDGTATPKVSPLVLTTGVTTLTVPANAIGIDLTAENDDICYGDNSTLDATSPAAGAGTGVLYEGGNKTIPLAGMTSFYLRARNDNALAIFHFIKL